MSRGTDLEVCQTNEYLCFISLAAGLFWSFIFLYKELTGSSRQDLVLPPQCELTVELPNQQNGFSLSQSVGTFFLPPKGKIPQIIHSEA